MKLPNSGTGVALPDGVAPLAHRAGAAAALLLILPVLKDGPLDIDLSKWKFFMVFGLLLISLPVTSQIIRGRLYQNIVVLLIFNLLLTVVAFLLSEARELSIDVTLVTAANTFYLIALCRLFNDDLLRIGVLSFILISLVVCAIAVLQYVVIVFHLTNPLLLEILPPELRLGYFEQGKNVGVEGVRVPSVFFHSNQFSHFLAVAFAFLFPLLLRTGSTTHRILYGFVIIALCSSLFLTQSRGGVMLVAVAAVLTMLLDRSLDWIRWKKLLFVLAGVVVVSSGVFFMNMTAFLARLASPGLSSRDLNWLYSVQLVPDHLIYGVGRGVAGYHTSMKYPAIDYLSGVIEYAASQPFNYWARNPHNYYLATILESGIFALIAELLIFGLLVKLGFKVIDQHKNSPYAACAIGATIALILEFMRGMFEANAFLTAPETGCLIAFLSALLLYLDSRQELDNPESRLRI